MIVLLKPVYNQILDFLRCHPDSTENEIRDHLVSIDAEMEFSIENYLDDLETLEFVRSHPSWDDDVPTTYLAIENKRDKVAKLPW